VLVEPDSNAGFMASFKTGEPDNYGPLGPLGGVNPTGFTPNGVPERTLAEAVRETAVPQPGTDYDWYGPTKLTAPGINGSTVPLPYGLDPNRVPLAGSYTTGPQQQSRLASAWYQLPKADAGHPLVVVTARGTIAGNSILHHHTNGQTVELEIRPARSRRLRAAGRPAGALRPVRGAAERCGGTCASRVSQMPDDAVAVRVVADDLSLTADDWIAGDPAAGTGAALVAGVHRLDATGADGLGGRFGLPVPAADAARQRGDRDPEVPHNPRTTTRRSRTPTPGRTASTAACWASPIAVAGARDVHLPVPRLGPRLGIAA